MKKWIIFFACMLGFVFSQKSQRIVISERADFLEGEMKNLYFNEQGILSLTPGCVLFQKSDELVLWKVFKSAAGLFAATGHNGKILYFPPSGEKREISTSSQEITVFAKGAGGMIYVGSGPKGILYRMDTNNQKAEIVSILPEDFIWDIAFDGENLFAATGNKGKIYKIDLMTGKYESFFISPEDNIVRVVWTKKGLIAATSGQGLVYRIVDNLNHDVLYDAGGRGISDIQVSGEDIYIATAGKKILYEGPNKTNPHFVNSVVHLDRHGNLTELVNLENSTISSLFLRGKSNLLFGTAEDGMIYQIDLKRHSYNLLYQIPNANIVNFSGDEKDAYFCTGADASVYKLLLNFYKEGSFTTKVFDTKRRSLWGRINFVKYGESEGEILFYTRTGNLESPNNSWSSWEKVEKQEIQSPPARFIQLRVVLSGGLNISPRLSDISIYFSQKNDPPIIKRFSFGKKNPKNHKVNVKDGKIFLQWDAEDKNGDRLIYDLYVRREDGKWRLFSEKITQSWHIVNRNAFVNGYYQFKLVASDSLDNPKGTDLKTSFVSRKYAMDNLSPVVKNVIYSDESIEFDVEDEYSSIKSLHYSYDKKDFYQALPKDMVYDHQKERFSIPLESVSSDEIILHIKDSSGNESYQRLPPQ